MDEWTMSVHRERVNSRLYVKMLALRIVKLL